MTTVGVEDRSFLEHHYYSGGLRIELLGKKATRPSWAPPQDWVGFRDEFLLGPKDIALEFVRFLYEEHHVSWLGLFRRSRDSVFGDRQNHAGCGIWLCDLEIADADGLLHDLREIFAALTPGDTAKLAGDVDYFQSDLLPKLVVQAGPLAEIAAGWPLASLPAAKTLALVANEDPLASTWTSVIDQIYRVSFLRDSNATASRLVMQIPGEQGVTASGLARARRGFLREFLSTLPQAMSTLVSTAQLREEKLKIAEAELLRFSSELDAAKDSIRSLTVRQRELVSQIESNDEAHRMSSIYSKLEVISGSLGRIETSNHQVSRDLQAISGTVGNREFRAVSDRVEFGSRSGHHVTTERPRVISGYSDGRIYYFIWGIVGVATVGLGALIVFAARQMGVF